MKRRIQQFLAVVMGILILQGVGAGISHADQYVHPAFAIRVNSSAGEINLRSGAGTGYFVLTTVPNGTVLSVTDMAYNMYDQFFFAYVNYAGYWGWVSVRQTDILNGGGYPAVDFYVSAAADAGSINFHTYAALAAPVITDIWNGTGFHITDVYYNPGDGFLWGLTSFQGMTGWISLRQTNFRRDYGNTPQYSMPAAENNVPPQPPTEPSTQPPAEPPTVSPAPQNIPVQTEQNTAPVVDEDPSNGIYCLYNNANGEQIDRYEENGRTFNDYRDIGERIDFTAVSVGQPGDYPSPSDWPHYAVIRGYDRDNNPAWTVETEEIYTLNGGYTAIGSSDKAFYYTDRKTIFALDLDTGKQLWTNDDIGKLGGTDGAFSGKAVGKEGELYVCASNGGGFLAVNAAGRTLTLRGGQMPVWMAVTDIIYDGQISTVMLENEEGEQTQITLKR